MQKTVALYLICPFLLCSFPLFAQSSCDTISINWDLARADELLAGGQPQQAADLSWQIYNTVRNCGPADSSYRNAAYAHITDCHLNSATELLYRGAVNQSIQVLERCLAICKQIPGDQSNQISEIHRFLSNSFGANENRKLALEHAVLSLKIKKQHNPDTQTLASQYDQIITNLIMLGEIDSVASYLREWENLERRLGAKVSPNFRLGLALKWADYYYETGQNERAIQVLEDTLAAYGDIARAKGIMGSGLVGIAEFKLCEYYTIVQNYRKALDLAEKNVAIFEKRLKQQRGKLLGKSHYAWCLGQAAKAAWGLFLQTGDTSWYHYAEQRVQKTEDQIFSIRDRKPDNGFSEWMGDDVDIVANVAEVRQGLYARTGNFYHAERAFEAVEASKTFAMQQFFHETYALRWSGLSDSVYQIESEYRNRINDMETRFFMLRSRPDADSLIAANDQELFALRAQYNVFLAALEKQQPEYFRLKYSHVDLDLKQLQTGLLKPEQCMLDLYIRNDLVMAMLIRPDTIYWFSTPFGEKENDALEKIKSESQLFPEYQNLPEPEYLRHVQEFADASSQAYQFLIAPVRPYLLEEVILIPRNDLIMFPFGSLLTRRETNMAKPFQWHFLDQELTLSQVFSASLFKFVQERKTRRPAPRTVLAMAPFFDGSLALQSPLPAGDMENIMRRDAFSSLPNSGVEARTISEITRGKALLGAEANKENLFGEGGDFQVLHFATHSAANDILGEYSYIALQSKNEAGKIDMLYARDIYEMNLSADLVVLSACETALGQYRYGDGLIGLNRAFTCAGAKNIVSSLWSVNDASTKNLMILFYREMQKGFSANRALANAKRAFIQENKLNAHPYYWAGFVLNGR